MTELDPSSVPSNFIWESRVFDSLRIALVGSDQTECGMLLFFDKQTKKLDAIEGFVFGELWPPAEAPAYWSEIDRIHDFRKTPLR